MSASAQDGEEAPGFVSAFVILVSDSWPGQLSDCGVGVSLSLGA